MHYLYRIIDTLNNKVYIGQSNKETERWRQHKYFARQENPIQHVHRAIKKYGVDNFIYEVITTCLTQEDADETEIQLIKQYDSRNKEFGYNIAPGGDHAWNAGLPPEQQPMFGKHHNEESKLKSSISNSGIEKPPHSQEWKDNMSEIMSGRISPMLGKKQSEYFIERMSEIHNGNTYALGLKHSEETKKQISKSNVGRSGPRGEKCGNAKLTWKIVAKIRKEFSLGNISKSKLAQKYDVSQPTINNIVMNKTWKLK